MDLHPEFDEIWKMGEMAAYPQEINGQIVSPFVHTVLHTIVDGQIRIGQPEFVVETFNRLREQEMEAIADMIAEVLTDVNNVDAAKKVRQRVRELTTCFPLPY